MVSWKYFKPDEMKCKCGQCGSTGHEMDNNFMAKLDLLRDKCNFPLVITSGYRCPDYNAKVAGTGKSGPHTTGKAADIAIDRMKAYHLLDYAMQLGFTGIGIDQKGNGRFIHLDTLTSEESFRPCVWSYP